ncbi:ABC transporter ATP-binding protein [Streptomyces coelicoflavus]|uniref:ABC transporter ATP-binding protein n=1 Tax=Streptomyces coelicoflavus TaxID=285562 RepID=UPI00381649C8
MTGLLRVTGLVAGYDRIEALHGVDLSVAEGRAATVIGPNGAGKSTLLRTVAGLSRAWRGTVEFDGTDVTRWPAERRARAGLVLVPEGRRVFAGLSVEENLRLGGYAAAGSAAAPGLSAVYDLFPALVARRRQPAGTLSGGEQQMVAIGRGLMSGPKVLLLDEPSLGLAPQAVRLVTDALVELAGRGTTLVLVEQSAAVAFRVAQEGHLMERGELAVSGPVERLRENPAVLRAYLGEPRIGNR